MEAWMAFVSIMAIVAIVVVGGGLIAFITHMILGVFDNGKQTTRKEEKGVIDYSQYKQLENSLQNSFEKEYDFEAINQVKAQKEKEMLEKEPESIFDIEEDKDEELEEIENRLKAETEEVKETAEPENVQNETVEEDVDDFDLDNMLSEISNDIIEEEKAQNETEEVKMSDELASYSIDDLLREAEENSEEVVEEENNEASEENETETLEENEEVVEEQAEQAEKVESFEDVQEESVEQDDSIEEEIQSEIKEETNAEVEALKTQLAELNRQLEEARSGNVRLAEINKKLEEQHERTEVVRIDMTEEECVARLETLEERLKSVKKEYKINSKEYRPLKKVMNDLEKYQTKLRRKETVVAKKKVSLYGVNNYVDIDKEKAEKLANELELLDGLRLSVSHCEEVINANKDRFPILEHTNQILEDQIANLEADIESTKLTLQKIRERNGNGEGSNDEGTNE